MLTKTTLRRTALLLLVFVPFLFLAEIHLSSRQWSRNKKLQDLRQTGIVAVPSLSPMTYLAGHLTHRPLLPLSGVPNVTTVVCKEEEELVYHSDRHGFNNPEHRWKSKALQVAFLGDSYVHGYCVKPPDHFISILESSFSVLNLGLFGSGPLSELAILMEYARLQKPKLVVWTYMANDLAEDLPLESSHPFLLRYLKGATQNLVQRSEELRKIQNDLLMAKPGLQRPFAFLSFPTLRTLFADLLLSTFRFPQKPKHQNLDYMVPEQMNWTFYTEILEQAREVVEAWGGQLVFLYLPEAGHWYPPNQHLTTQHRVSLKNLLKETQIDLWDFTPYLESQSKSPLEFYSIFSGQYGHFNKEGQEILARYLNTHIKAYNEKISSDP